MAEEQDKNKRMTQGYQEQEAKIAAEKEKAKQAEIAEKNKQIEDDTVYFVAKQAEHRIGNWREEDRYHNGGIKQREKSLEFHDNVLSTNDKEKIAFIRNSSSLRDGDVQEFKTKEEARKRIAELRAIKNGQKNLEVSDVEIIDTVGAKSASAVGVSSSAAG